MVVVNAKTEHSSTGRRLRKIKSLEGNMACFEPDRQKEAYNTRSLSEIEAKVTYVPIEQHSYTMKKIDSAHL